MKRLLKKILRRMNSQSKMNAEVNAEILNLPELEKYIAFSASKYLTREEQVAGFIEICTNSQVQHIAFSESGVLLIGTTPIKIYSSVTDRWHLIGEFIIEIERRPATIKFTNISGGISLNKETPDYYDHPHIANGKLCIMGGNAEMMNSISTGDISNALEVALVILNTSNGTPYIPAVVENWPII